MLADIAHPASATSAAGLNGLMHSTLSTIALAVGPVAGTCMVAGLLAGVAQVGGRPTPHALKPDFRRINPVSGLKNLLGPNLIFEALKAIVKVAVVGAVAALAMLPGLTRPGRQRRHLARQRSARCWASRARGRPARRLRLHRIGLIDYGWRASATSSS